MHTEKKYNKTLEYISQAPDGKKIVKSDKIGKNRNSHKLPLQIKMGMNT